MVSQHTPPESRADPQRLQLYAGRTKLILILLGSIAFVVLGAWLGSCDISRRLELWQIVLGSYIGIPFFGACGLFAGYRLVRRRPALELDSIGMTDAASAVGAGRLRWEEVDHAVLYKYSGQAMLGIVPKDLDAVLLRQPAFRRFVMRSNLALGCPPINIPQSGLSMNLAELAELLRTRHGVRLTEGS